MKITRFQVRNFKSFLDSGEIELRPGFNVITGQNSAGKTAMLEAMTLGFAASPHRSLRTIPSRGEVPSQLSVVRIAFALQRAELFQMMGGGQYFLPSPQAGFMIPGNGPYTPRVNEAQFLTWLSQEPDFTFGLQFEKAPNGGIIRAVQEAPLGKYPAAGPEADGMSTMLQVSAPEGRQLGLGSFSRTPSTDQYLTTAIAGQLMTRIYRFRAERFNVGKCPFGSSSVLAPDARNLPEAINTLTANPFRFRHLNELVREVLPQVRQISVRPVGGNEVQIIVWPHDPDSERDDLAIPLDECGSGIGQVLAILYVVMTSDHPQVMLVDEPQSFLHPGAVRKLIEVLKQYPDHQYILSTHSPTVITAAEPSTITMVRSDGPESSLRVIDPGSTKDLQGYLSDLGARLSDVFGADNILWVEGRTEETCFPRILRVLGNRPLMGTAILGVIQTGDLQGRDRGKLLEIYRRLSGASMLMPPALGFCLDAECMSDGDKQDLRRASQNLVHFLPRRMYENFLLNARAVAAVVNRIEGFRRPPVREDEVTRLLEAKRGERRYYCQAVQQIPADWIIHIDGARVLSEIFAELSENRVSYEKMRHSVAITEWILENNPMQFQELANWIGGLLPAAA
jgi:predicted ATPase